MFFFFFFYVQQQSVSRHTAMQSVPCTLAKFVSTSQKIYVYTELAVKLKPVFGISINFDLTVFAMALTFTAPVEDLETKQLVCVSLCVSVNI